MDAQTVPEKPAAADPEKTTAKETYRIYSYFKEHTAFFVACVSAAVAIMSFVIRYAAYRYNMAYLDVWNIDVAYAAQNNIGQAYSVALSFLYCSVLMVIHGLLSSTSDRFRQYNKPLSMLKWQHKKIRQAQKEKRKQEKRFVNVLGKSAEEIKSSPLTEKIEQGLIEREKRLQCLTESAKKTEAIRKICQRWVVKNIVIAVVVSYVIGLLAIALVFSTITVKTILFSLLCITCVIAVDMVIYFVPALLATRCTEKALNKLDINAMIRDLEDKDTGVFLLEWLEKGDFKAVFADSKIKIAFLQLLAVFLITVISFSVSATSSADLRNEFPIYQDDTGTYAAIYNNGETIVLEAAVIENDTIVINTARQKIIPAGEVSYVLQTFKAVETLDVADVKEKP